MQEPDGDDDTAGAETRRLSKIYVQGTSINRFLLAPAAAADRPPQNPFPTLQKGGGISPSEMTGGFDPLAGE